MDGTQYRPLADLCQHASRNGGGFSTFTYNIGPNSGDDRTGFIDFTWQGGGVRFQVNQTGTPFVSNLTLVDPFRSIFETDECWFRSMRDAV